MKLEFIPLDKLVVSRTNMRFGRRAPDVSDILPSVRRRGVLQPLLVRPVSGPAPEASEGPGCAAHGFEIVAGARRFAAACIVADERRTVRGGELEADPLACAVLDSGDDADAIEASLIENIARLDADEVTQWATFTRLVKEGRTLDDIGATFGLPDLAVRRVLALGNLLPRIRAMYAKEEIDGATIRHLTLASKRQQQDWLKLADDPDRRAPTGQQAKAWLLGGQSIRASVALFDVAASGLATVADLFGEDCYFANAGDFWPAQDAAVAARREAYLGDGWGEVVIVPPGEHFHSWEYEKTAKRRGGCVYIDVRATGEVTFHEGYVSRREKARAARAGAPATAKPPRAELTSALQTYVDLHRHAAVRAALAGHPGVALRLLVAHLIVGSPLWSVRREPQACRDDATRESVETSLGETRFDERRRAVLALLGMSAERATVTGEASGDYGLVRLFLRLLELPDAALGDVVGIVMGETLAASGAAVEAVGMTLGLDMAQWWQADPAFFALVRDREVLGAMVAEVAGEAVANANAKERGTALKRIVADHLAGANGRRRVEGWVPKWMAFPPAAYTARGGVGTVKASATVAAASRDAENERGPDPAAPDAAVPQPDPDDGDGRYAGVDDLDLPEALAA